MRSPAQFHGVTVQRCRLAANLHNANGVTVFVAEKLLDIRALLRVGVRNLGPGNGRILADLFVNESLHFLFLLWGQCGAAEIEGELLRTDVTAFLRCFARNFFVKSPMQKMRDSVMTLN